MRLLVSDPLDRKTVGALRDAGIVVDVRDDITPEELETTIALYDAIVVRSRTRLTASLLDRASRLKLIIRAGVGLDNIDVQYALSKGIEVCNTPTASSKSVAELTIGYVLALARQIPQMTLSMKENHWEKGAFSRGIEVAGKTLGLIGCGRIGIRVARMALFMGMDVLYYCLQPYPNIPQARPVSLEKLVSCADFISLHVPYGDGTKYILGAKEFAKMKDGVYIINCGRGGTLDEEALYEAIISGKVAGAALDVFEKEKTASGQRLMALPQVIGSPHVGAGTVEARKRVAEAVVRIATEFAARSTPCTATVGG